MPLLDYARPDELNDELRATAEKMRDARGDVPAFLRMIANNPHSLRALIGQFGAVMYTGEVAPDLKQLAFVVYSSENRCAYCAATHGELLVQSFGLPEARLQAIAQGDYTSFTDRERAVAAFARQAARDAKQVDESHVEALRAAGFADAEIVELLTVVAQASFANTIVDVMDIVPSDDSPELKRYYPQPTAV